MEETSYPPGSFGAEWERIDRELEEVARRSPFWLAWYPRVMRRRLAAARLRLRRSIPAQLEAAGFIDAETRARLERLEREATADEVPDDRCL